MEAVTAGVVRQWLEEWVDVQPEGPQPYCQMDADLVRTLLRLTIVSPLDETLRMEGAGRVLAIAPGNGGLTIVFEDERSRTGLTSLFIGHQPMRLAPPDVSFDPW